jgi:hypothetical protein
MGIKILQRLLFFFFLQVISLYLALVRENWVLIFLRVELSVISFIPLSKFSKTNKFSVKFFVMKVLGSILLLLGQLKFNSLLLSIGFFIKLRIFPVFWLPLRLKKNINNWVYFWLFSFQKIPLYVLWKEFFLIKYYMFFFSVVITLILGSVYMFNSSTILEFLRWKNIIHSTIKLLLIKYVEMNIFILCLFLYIISIFVCIFYIKNFNLNFNGLLKKRIKSFLFFLRVIGLPLFVKVIAEIILFFVLKKMWGLIVIIRIVIQLSSFIRVLLCVFEGKNDKNTKINLFLFWLIFLGFLIIRTI